MAHLDNVRPIRAIDYGGPVEQGHGIAFRIQFEDGGLQNCYCRSDQLGPIVANLTNMGYLAEQLRGGVKAGEVHVATPYEVNKITNSAPH